MRYKLYFTLENEHFPIQYRKSILSFLKLSLKEYDVTYYQKLYHKKDNIIKPYTFSVFFKQPEFKDEEIIIKDKSFQINLSIENYEIAIIIYNALNHQKQKKFSLNKNSWVLQNISMLMEKDIKDNKVIVKFMSPLVVRERKDEKDYYHSFKSMAFYEIIKINIKQQLKISSLLPEIVDTFNIKPINAKKTVIKFYEKQIECSLGIFELMGDSRLLNYLYKSGIGSKHSAGFGMFQVL